MEYLLGIDFGGSSSKATLIDRNGAIICTATREYPLYYPADGWCEQSPLDCYDACVKIIREILERSAVSPGDIAAMAVDSATHMAVLLDDRDQVIRNVIHWSDRRSSEESAYLQEHHLSQIRRLCLNEPSPLWTLPQLMWLQKQEPESLKQTSRLLFMKDYIRHRLTGDYLTDRIEAMGAMLMDEGKEPGLRSSASWRTFLLLFFRIWWIRPMSSVIPQKRHAGKPAFLPIHGL